MCTYGICEQNNKPLSLLPPHKPMSPWVQTESLENPLITKWVHNYVTRTFRAPTEANVQTHTEKLQVMLRFLAPPSHSKNVTSNIICGKPVMTVYEVLT